MLCAAAPAAAQSKNLSGGEVRKAVGATLFGGRCYVGRGVSFFQRDLPTATSFPKAFISFSEIVDQGKYDLSGQAVMSFATAAAGHITFKFTGGVPLASSSPAFINYVQVYDAAQRRLSVHFVIKFPDCNLPIDATYDGI